MSSLVVAKQSMMVKCSEGDAKKPFNTVVLLKYLDV